MHLTALVVSNNFNPLIKVDPPAFPTWIKYIRGFSGIILDARLLPTTIEGALSINTSLVIEGRALEIRRIWGRYVRNRTRTDITHARFIDTVLLGVMAILLRKSDRREASMQLALIFR